ncbi:MAG TPA: CocE/NonD family hydrolase, partial [Bdellovibrionota bacterium]
MLFLATLFLLPLQGHAEAALYEFDLKPVIHTVRDGTKIALTFYEPRAKQPGEKFPVLFSMNPYRKDDLFAARDFELYHYFAERGFLLVRADVRGTGSSSGPVPRMEYSRAELDDAVELIEWLRTIPASNGNIGMWGLSWGGFNSLQVAMRNPTGLKAILAGCASDDLHRDDIHYVDGIFHIDEYMLDMDHEVALPAPPRYEATPEFEKDRLGSYPWILTYLHQQRDGAFWRANSLRWQYDKIHIPIYLFGGLLDTYRDSIPRMLKSVRAPIRAVMGPWIHTWPDIADSPGPSFEWRSEAVDFWNQWLRPTAKASAPPKKSLRLFLRDYYPPSLETKSIPGRWCELKDGQYSEPLRLGVSKDKLHLPGERFQTSSGTITLKTNPAEGEMAGFYWGELTGPMKTTDGVSFVSAPLSSNLVIAGMPRMRFRARSQGSGQVNWVVRLEDVNEAGESALVDGSALNGSQRKNRLKPRKNTGAWEWIETDLHFTTWTFRPGHRVRIVISHSSFPMLWPSPGLVTSEIRARGAFLELPRFTADLQRCPFTAEPKPAPRLLHPDFSEGEHDWPANYRSHREGDQVFLDAQGKGSWKLKDWSARLTEFARQGVSMTHPENATYEGWMEHIFEKQGKGFSLHTTLSITSDSRD